ncbi:FGGY-family carbohydrate kinase [Pararhizobium sp. IMCC21322]|uniref:xylulokinase n=1 Tax=Pararhizobium sp. IMCC21322 TaxID=3067903 RepID=UPI002742459E|nr:FGGY family carbohydrate kinase [Pararhizobium sp. IMCC21322]
MAERLIIGLDSSTQSTKAIAWTKSGEIVAEGRADIPMQTSQKDYCEQDPNDWWDTTVTALNQLAQQIDVSLVDGLAISNQRETIGFFDAELNSVHPAMVWLDSRSGLEADELSERVGRERLHTISGKPKDIIPSNSSVMWVRKNRPDVFNAASQVREVGSYLHWHLAGVNAVSWASADPSGMFDIERKEWSDEILAVVGVTRDQFAKPVPPGTLVGGLTDAAAEATGLKAGTPIFAGAGDGQCAGLGVDAAKEGRVYLNLGTAVVTGLWSKTPNISNSWRTMLSPTGDGYFLEGVMRGGTYFLDWMVKHYIAPDEGNAAHEALHAKALELPVGSDGLMVCPYLSGCMNPFWDANAKAAIYGISPAHDTSYLYRASMEGLTGEVARTIFDMRDQGLKVTEIIGVGGGANSPLWRQMLVDATGIPLTLSKSLEASSLGAAMIAAVGTGWFESFDEASQAMSATGETYHPDPVAHKEWKVLLERQQTFNAFCCHNETLS